MITDILPKLEKVKPGRGQGQWLARCPAHIDNSPSLSLKELSDGKVIIKCWSGCETRDVVNAIGLDLRCLFPPEPEPIQGSKPAMPSWRRKQLQAKYRYEQLIVAVFDADVKARRFINVNPTNIDRYITALTRLRLMHKEGIA